MWDQPHPPADAGPAAIAAAMLASYARGRVLTSSAGQRPAAGIDPAIARVAADLNVDLSDAFPKAVTREAVQVADVVVTLGEVDSWVTRTPEKDADGERILHWNVPPLTDQQQSPTSFTSHRSS